MKKTIISVFFLIISCTVTHAEIYKWRDAEGKLHFSDKPMTGAAQTVDVFDSSAGKAPVDRQPTRQSERTERPRAEKSPRHITAADYKINSSAKFDRDGVTISGRISGGPKCDNLRVRAYAASKNGRTASCTDVTSTKGLGFGSAVFSCVDPWKSDRLDSWEVSEVYVTCAN